VRPRSLLPLALLAAPLLAPAIASAQAVGDRPVLGVDGNPDYATQDRYDFLGEAHGVQAGPFELVPTAAETAAYDTNVLAAPSQRRESALSITQALLQVTNEPGGLWDFDGQAYARARRFTQTSDQNTTEYGGSTSIEGEASPHDDVSASFLAQHRFEARTDVETPTIEEVSPYDQLQGNVSYAHTYDRLQVRYVAGAQSLDYQDASQKYRDRSDYQGSVNASYGLPSGLALLGSAYYVDDVYRFESPSVTGGRTFGARAGAQGSITEVVDFELSAGYFRRTMDHDLGELSGLTVLGSLIYYPTQLTTIRADVSRSDYPTRIPGAYSKVRTDSLLEIGHAYSRSLNLYARARVVIDDFSTIGRTDKTYLGEVGGFYEISRSLVLGVEYDYSERASLATSSSFLQNLVSISLIAKL
jgi:hypothetical protein